MEENVNGCYAQKPLKCIDRIIRASSTPGQLVLDFFSHSGTTLLASEILKRRCFTIDTDPIFCEISIRRLENYRKTGRLGWQNSHAFEHDLPVQFEPTQEESVALEPTNNKSVEPDIPRTASHRGQPPMRSAEVAAQAYLF